MFQSQHFKVDIEVGGQLVHHVGILVKKDKVPLLDTKGHKAKTPALLGSYLIRIALNKFVELHREECLCLFECPVGISPLWFFTLCLYYYAHVYQKTGVGASSVFADDPNKGDKDNSNGSSNSHQSRSQKSNNKSEK